MITYEKEIKDALLLAKKIEESNWMDDSVVIVTCSPDYSSISSQIINHALSHLIGNELFEREYLEMPYPVNSQVFDPIRKEYTHYDQYLKYYTSQLSPNNKYLFYDSGVIRGKNFKHLHSSIKKNVEYRFASLYVEENAIFIPDYYVEKYKQSEGGLIFQWENPKNPNWNY